MWIEMNQRFRDETEQYRFVFTCQDCDLWLEKEDKCSIHYPTEPHRQETVDATPDGERLYFCKMFEAKQ